MLGTSSRSAGRKVSTYGLVLSVFVGAKVLAAPVPAKTYATILLRTLSLDNNLKIRQSDKLTLAFVYKHKDKRSAKACKDIAAQLRALAKTTTVSSLPIKVLKPFPFSNKATLGVKLRDNKAGALNVCSGLEGKTVDIKAVTRMLSVLTFSGSSKLVELGLSVGIVASDDKASIKINLAASRAEGAKLDAALLKMSTVIR